MRVTVSLAQFNAGMGHPHDNATVVYEWTREAAHRRSDLLLLPELWHDGLDYERAREVAAPLDGGPFAFMAEQARAAGLWLAGSAFEKDGEHVYNTLALFSPAGVLVSAYRKAHLFPPMHEDRYLKAGSELSVIDTPWGKIGLAICYDLRFPELFRRLALKDAQICLLPAQWPLSRLEHWRTLVQARAIENQLFMVACNRVGADGDVRFGGHSVICDPWGNRLLEAGLEPVLLTIAIDPDRIAMAREHIPVFQNRRPELY